MKIVKKVIVISLLFIAIAFVNKVFATPEEQTEVTKDVETKIYIKPDTSIRIIPNIASNVIYTSSKNTNIQIIEQLNNWTYILVDNRYGWVRTDKLLEVNSIQSVEETNNNETTVVEKETTAQKKTEINANTKIGYIKYNIVNLRKEASATSTILQKLELNDKITILKAVDNVWYKVQIEDGTIGYVSRELVSDKKQEVTSTEKRNDTTSRSAENLERVNGAEIENTAVENKTEINTVGNISEETITGEKIAEYAKQFVGYKYVYGGTSPETGFDCSGLAYYVYKQFGYTINRTASGQVNNGVEVAKEDLKPGDLIIFKNTALTKIGHVGIYIGNNKMVHASEPKVGVKISDIDAGKYPQRYVTSRRIVK